MKYRANPVEVEAFKIVDFKPAISDENDGGLVLYLQDAGCEDAGALRCYFATKPMLARTTPKIGDYLVVQSDGYTYLNPKEVFERKYSPVELNALELGAAVRRAGLAGQ